MIIKKLGCWVLCCWVFMLPLAAQEISLSGIFEPQDRSPAYISVLGTTKQNKLIAEAKVIQGAFTMSIPQDLPYGVYKLGFSTKDKMQFYWVHDGEKNYYLQFTYHNNDWHFVSTTGKAHTYLSKYWQQNDSLMIGISSLYNFLQTYPHKTEFIYKTASTILDQKITAFKNIEDKAITNAPEYANEVLAQNKIIFYNPAWDEDSIKANYFEELWRSIPINDTLYYNKPFFLDKLTSTFQTLIEDKTKPEIEKYQEIKGQLEWLLPRFSNYAIKQKYYNLCLRYFANNNYPYVLNLIDQYINLQEPLLLEQDTNGFLYRKSQQDLLGKPAPPIISQNNSNALDNLEASASVLVFVGGNSPYSFQLLNQLQEDVAHSTVYKKVIAVLLTEDEESIANFKNRFATWEVVSITNESVNGLVKSYNLIYAPTIFILDKNKNIEKILAPFERLPN